MFAFPIALQIYILDIKMLMECLMLRALHTRQGALNPLYGGIERGRVNFIYQPRTRRLSHMSKIGH